MKHFSIICTILAIFTTMACTKQLDYEMAITSAQSREVIITYPNNYWGNIESLVITHEDNKRNPVDFHPMTTDSEGMTCKSIRFLVPNPNQNGLEWSEDRLSAKGYSTLAFKSDTKEYSLTFEFSLSFSEDTELLGGSSMYVSAVSSKDNRVERTSHPFNDKFVIDIDDLAK